MLMALAVQSSLRIQYLGFEDETRNDHVWCLPTNVSATAWKPDTQIDWLDLSVSMTKSGRATRNAAKRRRQGERGTSCASSVDSAMLWTVVASCSISDAAPSSTEAHCRGVSVTESSESNLPAGRNIAIRSRQCRPRKTLSQTE